MTGAYSENAVKGKDVLKDNLLVSTYNTRLVMGSLAGVELGTT